MALPGSPRIRGRKPAPLTLEGGEAHELLPPHQRLRFAGESAVMGELIDGRTEDFNLMWRREAVDAQLWHRPLVGAMVVFVDPGSTWAVHLLAGHARIDDLLLALHPPPVAFAGGVIGRRHAATPAAPTTAPHVLGIRTPARAKFR